MVLRQNVHHQMSSQISDVAAAETCAEHAFCDIEDVFMQLRTAKGMLFWHQCMWGIAIKSHTGEAAL